MTIKCNQRTDSNSVEQDAIVAKRTALIDFQDAGFLHHALVRKAPDVSHSFYKAVVKISYPLAVVDLVGREVYDKIKVKLHRLNL